jgi:hypothetical protein
LSKASAFAAARDKNFVWAENQVDIYSHRMSDPRLGIDLSVASLKQPKSSQHAPQSKHTVRLESLSLLSTALQKSIALNS